MKDKDCPRYVFDMDTKSITSSLPSTPTKGATAVLRSDILSDPTLGSPEYYNEEGVSQVVPPSFEAYEETITPVPEYLKKEEFRGTFYLNGEPEKISTTETANAAEQFLHKSRTIEIPRENQADLFSGLQAVAENTVSLLETTVNAIPGAAKDAFDAGKDLGSLLAGTGEYKFDPSAIVNEGPVKEEELVGGPQEDKSANNQTTQWYAFLENDCKRVQEQDAQNMLDLALQKAVDVNNLGELVDEPNRRREELLNIYTIAIGSKKQADIQQTAKQTAKTQSFIQHQVEKQTGQFDIDRKEGNNTVGTNTNGGQG